MTNTRVGCQRARLVQARDSSCATPNRRRSCTETRKSCWPLTSQIEPASSMSRVILLVTVALAVAGGFVQASHANSNNNNNSPGPTPNQVYKSSGEYSSAKSHDPNSQSSIMAANIKRPQIQSQNMNQTEQVAVQNKRSAADIGNKSKTSTTREPTNNSSEGPRDATTPVAPTSSKSPLLNTTETSSPPPTTSSTTTASKRAQKHTDSRMGGGGAGDLAASSSSLSSSLAGSSSTETTKQAQPKRSSSSAASGNRWTHFGARLRPLAGAAASSNSGQSMNHHHHQQQHEAAASSSKATAALAEGGANSQLLGHHRQQGRTQISSKNQLVHQLQGNSLDATRGATANRESAADQEGDDEDDDDLDSEALLYKMMQQQSFLMNPNFQDQQVVASMPLEPSQQQQQQQSQQQQVANGQQQQQAQSMAGQQQQHDDNMAKSKRVIKLLKSYSHIHQVDDSDDQIRGSYGRYQRPATGGSNQYQAQSRPPINKSGQQQHIFVSSRPVTTSQTRQQTQVYATEDDGQYRPMAAHSSRQRPTADESYGSQDAPQEDPNNNSPNGPAEEEDDFECPNNGIFADVASGCQAYHVCQSASQVQQRFQCPLGTLFNDIILTCDFAHNVQCGKKPGELGSAAVPSVNQQQNQQVELAPDQHQHQPRNQNHVQPSRQQSNTGNGQSFVRPQQMQAQQQRHQQPFRPSPGPRQLVIGSPYNLHNQQRPAQSQAQTLSAYPSIKPLSNSLGGNSNSNNDDEDDNEDDEKLVPATLPPRIAPVLPFQAPPQPQATTPSLPATSPSRPINKLAYQQRQQATRPAQQQQPKQQQRPRYQPAAEASTPASNYGASAAPPTFIEPNPPQNPERATSASPGGSQPEDMQSYSLVINHIAPAKQAASGRQQQHQELPTTFASHNFVPQQQPQQQQQQQQQSQNEFRSTSNKQFGQFVSSHKSSDNSDRPVQKAHQQNHQKATQQRQTAHSRPKLQQQAPNGNTILQSHANNSGSQANHVKQHRQTAQRQESQSSNVASHSAPSLNNQRYESRRELARQQNRNRQVAAQLPQVTPTSTPASYSEATPAASQPSVSHRQHGGSIVSANKIDASISQDGIRQLQQQQQQHQRLLQDSAEGVLNDGVFLIIRHSSSSPALQVGDGTTAASFVAGASPLASQTYGFDKQQATAATPKAPQIYGLLPPMDPPAPQPHDHHYQQQQADVQQQHQPTIQQNQQYANSDQLVSSASSAPASAEATSAKPLTTPLKGQQTATTSQLSSPVRTQKSQTSSKNPGQQQQATRIRRAKRIKPATTPSKSQHQSSTATSTTTNATTSTTSTTTGGNNVDAKDITSNTTSAKQQ